MADQLILTSAPAKPPLSPTGDEACGSVNAARAQGRRADDSRCPPPASPPQQPLGTGLDELGLARDIVGLSGGLGALGACLLICCCWLAFVAFRKRRKRTFRMVYRELAIHMGNAQHEECVKKYTQAVARSEAVRKGMASPQGLIPGVKCSKLDEIYKEEWPYNVNRANDAEPCLNAKLICAEAAWATAIQYDSLTQACNSESAQMLQHVVMRAQEGPQGPDSPIAELLDDPLHFGRLDGRCWRLLRELNRLAAPQLAVPAPGQSAWQRAFTVLHQNGRKHAKYQNGARLFETVQLLSKRAAADDSTSSSSYGQSSTQVRWAVPEQKLKRVPTRCHL
jgi:hypothetical protein